MVYGSAFGAWMLKPKYSWSSSENVHTFLGNPGDLGGVVEASESTYEPLKDESHSFGKVLTDVAGGTSQGDGNPGGAMDVTGGDSQGDGKPGGPKILDCKHRT